MKTELEYKGYTAKLVEEAFTLMWKLYDSDGGCIGDFKYEKAIYEAVDKREKVSRKFPRFDAFIIDSGTGDVEVEEVTVTNLSYDRYERKMLPNFTCKKTMGYGERERASNRPIVLDTPENAERLELYRIVLIEISTLEDEAESMRQGFDYYTPTPEHIAIAEGK